MSNVHSTTALHEPTPQRARPRAGDDLSNSDLSGQDLSGLDLSQVDFSGANLQGANLKGTVLLQAKLDGAELLMADLEGADLTECSAQNAGFGRCNLRHTLFFSGNLSNASFSGANLHRTDLRVANLEGARFRDAHLTDVNLRGANLRSADITNADVTGASFEESDLRRAHVKGVVGFEKASWIGADIQDVDFCGAYRMRRFVMDQNYLHEFRNRSRTSLWMYRIWWLTSDCGRSFLRWAIFTLLLAAGFGALYSQLELSYMHGETALSPFYFSVVTLTTLGYGDVLPVSTAAKAVAMVQVMLGYVMLGGLLSIFAENMGRRAS